MDLNTEFWLVVSVTILLAVTGVPRKIAPWVIAAVVALGILVT